MPLGDSKRYPAVDFGNPRQFSRVVRNMVNVYNATPEQVRNDARDWYPRVHDYVTRGVKGTSTSHTGGSGLVAAVSPNMDFEKNNVHAIKELHHLTGQDWDVIHQSAATKGPRSGEAKSLLQGMSISMAPDANLLQAHRILQGEHPDQVLNRRTAPKTNSFFHNIEEPEENTHVTIDGRQHDIGNNRMYPWTYSGRGISSAVLKSGQPTRYEHFENAVRRATERVGEKLPQQFQAITWEGGKLLERGGNPSRKKGAARKGQPYVPK